ncbi:peptide/nickel transport system substrate-binding protein [Kitasatospora sp. MAA19]|uniref:ABC transporter substrate-binding protein n=1 Tax=unclassified Kitasatospora TaxID=2633591 RepID=UPI002475BA89|nr:ABC transporter substrate-binding protein [Kitasatospora sp. MAA19]MDH6708103.1 peptide/nickel transport system substrate-binding protein [Kitasatospora sp. MAA19]
MKTSAERLAVLGCAGLVAVTAAGCGSVTDAVKGEGGKAITMGTTQLTGVLDPAAAYDSGSWLLLRNTFQSLLAFPAASSAPSPDAAQSCEFPGGDATQFHCTLRSGLKFSNGHPMTAADVVFSIERTKKINDENGPAALLSSIKSVEAKGDTEVIFQLTAPDATLPAKLAGPAGAIVDHQVYPADKVAPNDKQVGSGPYRFDSVESLGGGNGTAKQLGKVVLVPNDKYSGEAKLRNSKFTVRYFDKPADLKTALDKGDVDLTDNSLEPNTAAQIHSDQQGGKTDLQVVEGDSNDTRSLVFNTKDPVGGNLAVRQAAAQLIDRKALARDVFARTVQPLYSMVPAGVTGHTTAFFDRYGDQDAGKAKKILTDAKVQTPVKLTLSWSRSRAGSAEPDMLKKQLEAGGLFQVTVQQEPDWDKYRAGWAEGRYQAYVIGWFADFPDPDNYTAPMLVDGGAYHHGWDDPRISQKLVPDGQKQADRSAAAGGYAQIQQIVAENAPLIPLYQNKAFFAARSSITGVESTVDTTGVFRFWEISRSSK